MTARSGLRNVATAVALITASAFVAGFAGVRVNTSSSLPLGLYIRTDQSSARLIEFCPSEPYAIAIARPWLPRSRVHLSRSRRSAPETGDCACRRHRQGFSRWDRG